MAKDMQWLEAGAEAEYPNSSKEQGKEELKLESQYLFTETKRTGKYHLETSITRGRSASEVVQVNCKIKHEYAEFLRGQGGSIQHIVSGLVERAVDELVQNDRHLHIDPNPKA